MAGKSRTNRTNSSIKPPIKAGSDAAPATSEAAAGGSRSPIAIVGVGASAGGIEAFTALLEALPVTFAQDESAQQDGMPRSAMSSGCVDFVLSPAQIATELTQLGAHLRERGRLGALFRGVLQTVHAAGRAAGNTADADDAGSEGVSGPDAQP